MHAHQLAASLVEALNAHDFGREFTARRVLSPVFDMPRQLDVTVYVPRVKWGLEAQTVSLAVPTVAVDIRLPLAGDDDPAADDAMDLAEKIARWALAGDDAPPNCTSVSAEQTPDQDDVDDSLAWICTLELTYLLE